MNVKMAWNDLFTLNKETFDMDKTDYLVWFGTKGVPIDLLTALESLWDTTKRIGKTTLHIGKIIIMKLVEFIEAHPHALIGMILGAAVGTLVNLVPFLGQILAPIGALIGALYGFYIGNRLDYCAMKEPTTPYEGLILLAKDFFAQLIEIFTLLKKEFC